MEFNIFDFSTGLEDLRNYIGDSPSIELKDNSIDIYGIPSSIQAEKLLEILYEMFSCDKYYVLLDRDSTGFYHVKVIEKNHRSFKE